MWLSLIASHAGNALDGRTILANALEVALAARRWDNKIKENGFCIIIQPVIPEPF